VISLELSIEVHVFGKKKRRKKSLPNRKSKNTCDSILIPSLLSVSSPWSKNEFQDLTLRY